MLKNVKANKVITGSKYSWRVGKSNIEITKKYETIDKSLKFLFK